MDKRVKALIEAYKDEVTSLPARSKYNRLTKTYSRSQRDAKADFSGRLQALIEADEIVKELTTDLDAKIADQLAKLGE